MRVTLDGNEVFMDADELPAFTYVAPDVFDPSKITGTRSTSFVLPGTQASFANAGPLAMSEATPLPKELKIGEAGVDYITAKVLPIESSVDGYTLACVAENGGWIEAAKNTKIRDLDLGVTNSSTAAEMKSSWADEDGLVVYPVIDYGSIDPGDIAVSLDHVRPALRVHRALAKFFEDHDYTFTATGSVQRTWKKIILPTTHEDLRAEQWMLNEDDLDNSSATAAFTTVPYTIVQSGAPNPYSFEGIALPVPHPNMTDAGVYTSPNNRRVTVAVVDHALGYNGFDPAYTGTQWEFVLWDGTDGAAVASYVLPPLLGGFLDPDITFAFEDVLLVSGHVYWIGIRCATPLPTIDQPTTGTLIWGAVRSQYSWTAAGVRVIAASIADKSLTVMDLLTGYLVAQGALILTDDTTRTATIKRIDDHYRAHELEGVDRMERQTHPVTRLTPLKVKSMHFRWKQDKDDVNASQLDVVVGGRGYGGEIHEVEGGILKGIDVELPFAATAMKWVIGNRIFIPSMRKKDQAPNTLEFDWVPRLLIHDGMADGSWYFGAELLAQYPNVYFVRQGAQYGLSFANETVYGPTFPGIVSTYLRNYLYRLDNSKFIRANVRLFDDELIDMDFGVPVLLSDGSEPGWYYFTEVKQKRFGLDEPTECEFIQA